MLAVGVALLLACVASLPAVAASSSRDLHNAHAEWMAALDESHEIAAEAVDEIALADDLMNNGEVGPALLESPGEVAPASESSSFAELASEEHSSSHTRSHSAIRNGPITPVHRVAEGAALQWKAGMPAKMKFARMLAEAEDRLKHPEMQEKQQHSMVESHSRARAKQSMRSRARAASRSRAHSRSQAHSRAHARVGGDAPDGSDGDWTTKPSWWNPPSDVESASPWREDAHAYLLRHRDPNTNMNPDPFPTLASRGAGNMAMDNPIQAFAMHRLAGTEVLAGTPMSVYAHQFPGAPPLPELDATMQPTNNYPNPPFYEHDYNKDYVWG